MAKETKPNPVLPSNVVSLSDSRCQAEGCKAKHERASFCGEHFEWFKVGLITKEGKQALDFDKKYQHFMSAKKKAA